MATPRSIRFEDDTLERLAAFASRRPGVTSASAAARFVEEGLRMDAHPSIHFRDGASGRRAVVIGGPDVWEVVKAVQDARRANPRLKGERLKGLVVENTGVTPAQLNRAIDYYSAYPEEIDSVIREASALEAKLTRELQQREKLLGA